MSISRWASSVPHFQNQLYISTSRNPFLNLSIEHFLLQISPSNSRICFLYINEPSVVIGRNQNPWLEVNLPALARSDPRIQLVRRRSGGGAVFHDEGNLNYCAICPIGEFVRDKHAEMVTAAIRSFQRRARVNSRHDIVLDQGDYAPMNLRRTNNYIEDLHRTVYHTDDTQRPPLKVSGSAFKIIKGRALHHGTCLLSCDRLSSISHLLHAPGRGFISAKGVESVRSPVGNAFLVPLSEPQRSAAMLDFALRIVKRFLSLHHIENGNLDLLRDPIKSNQPPVRTTIDYDLGTNGRMLGWLGDDVLEAPEIQGGVETLKVHGSMPPIMLYLTK